MTETPDLTQEQRAAAAARAVEQVSATLRARRAATGADAGTAGRPHPGG